MMEFTDLPKYHLTRSEIGTLHEKSCEAKSLAYCTLVHLSNIQGSKLPGVYSNFQVGSALLLNSDLELAPSVVTRIIKGANMENASYPVGICAERVALGAAICHYGLSGSQIKAIGVAANTKEPISPCGACRQFIREFVTLDTPIVMFGNEDKWTVMSIGEVSVISGYIEGTLS
jgi:cytidine deaminase